MCLPWQAVLWRADIGLTLAACTPPPRCATRTTDLAEVRDPHGSIQVLAVVPARSGSKSVPHKNIRCLTFCPVPTHPLPPFAVGRLLAGKPMLAYSIQHAQEATLVDRVLVSTDSEQYRDIAIQHGAEVRGA